MVPRATETAPSARFLPGIPGRGRRSCWAEPPVLILRALQAGSFWGIQGHSLTAPACRAPQEGPGFLSKPRAGVTRPPSSEETWPLGPTKLPSASHLQTPVPSRHQLVSAGRAAGRTGPPRLSPGLRSGIADIRRAGQHRVSPGPPVPAPRLPAPLHPRRRVRTGTYRRRPAHSPGRDHVWPAAGGRAAPGLSGRRSHLAPAFP